MEHISLFWSLCTECDLHFPTPDALSKHVATMHYVGSEGIKQPKKDCQFCPVTFPMISDYTRHANDLHLDLIKEDWLRCQICGYFLQTELCLARHTGRHEGFSAKQISCEFCSVRFQYHKKYYKHANESHPEEVLDKWQFCNKCLLYFPSTHHIHFKETVAMVTCKFCSAGFNRGRILVQHCNAEHRDQILSSWIICEKCNLYYPTRVSLKSHSKCCGGKIKSLKENSARKKRVKNHDDDEGVISDVIKKSRRKRKVKTYEDFDFEVEPSMIEIVPDLDIGDEEEIPLKRSRRERKGVEKKDFIKLEEGVDDDEADLSDLYLSPDDQVNNKIYFDQLLNIRCDQSMQIVHSRDHKISVGIPLSALRLPETSSLQTFSCPLTE